MQSNIRYNIGVDFLKQYRRSSSVPIPCVFGTNKSINVFTLSTIFIHISKKLFFSSHRLCIHAVLRFEPWAPDAVRGNIEHKLIPSYILAIPSLYRV